MVEKNPILEPLGTTVPKKIIKSILAFGGEEISDDSDMASDMLVVAVK